jgi:EAL domain-containing protein (putative c-di-GMP-specific phosphodiesterase class I)
VAAILSLAERLGIDTLAEGVETRGEQAMLSQLGCGHLQGFAIARPMPVEETADWIARHNASRVQPPRIGQRAGKG